MDDDTLMAILTGLKDVLMQQVGKAQALEVAPMSVGTALSEASPPEMRKLIGLYLVAYAPVGEGGVVVDALKSYRETIEVVQKTLKLDT